MTLDALIRRLYAVEAVEAHRIGDTIAAERYRRAAKLLLQLCSDDDLTAAALYLECESWTIADCEREVRRFADV